jgi:tetratricopeptide (TPR) repeat protein
MKSQPIYSEKPPSEEVNKVKLNYSGGPSDLEVILDLGRENVHIVMSGKKSKSQWSGSQNSETENGESKGISQEVLREIREAQQSFYEKRYAGALEQVRRSLEKQETAEGYALMGSILYVMGQKQNAKNSWERALEINPNMPTVLDMLNRYERSTVGN